MIFIEQHINEREISKLIGSPITVNLNKNISIGGSGLFLKSFTNRNDLSDDIKPDSKCNFERRPNGLLIHTNFSNKRTLVAIPEEEIVSIQIKRGKEKITPCLLSPMWILLKFGVSIRYARYFRTRLIGEYWIEEMELSVSTTNYDFIFIASGYSFEEHLEFLTGLNYGDKLISYL